MKSKTFAPILMNEQAQSTLRAVAESLEVDGPAPMLAAELQRELDATRLLIERIESTLSSRVARRKSA